MTKPPIFAAIVPPYIFEALESSGSAHQKGVATTHLNMDVNIRNMRIQQQAANSPTRSDQSEARPTRMCRKNRLIHHNEPKGARGLPGVMLRGEADPACGDGLADAVFAGLGDAFDFYQQVFGRQSIDHQCGDMVATVHYDQKFANAFWNGTQMVFGDGDGEIFREGCFADALDIIGHELTHGVIQYSSSLQYANQAGAISESICDVMGSLLKQWKLGQTVAQADWLIGAGLFAPTIQGVALRSMQAPGTAFDDPKIGRDPQPAHFRDIIRTEDNYGGVHLNSGILNRAFYLAAMEIGGYAWEKTGQIWYHTLVSLTAKAKSSIGFVRFAQAIMETAAERFGPTSPEWKAVRHAWEQVGVIDPT